MTSPWATDPLGNGGSLITRRDGGIGRYEDGLDESEYTSDYYELAQRTLSGRHPLSPTSADGFEDAPTAIDTFAGRSSGSSNPSRAISQHERKETERLIRKYRADIRQFIIGAIPTEILAIIADYAWSPPAAWISQHHWHWRARDVDSRQPLIRDPVSTAASTDIAQVLVGRPTMWECGGRFRVRFERIAPGFSWTIGLAGPKTIWHIQNSAPRTAMPDVLISNHGSRIDLWAQRYEQRSLVMPHLVEDQVLTDAVSHDESVMISVHCDFDKNRVDLFAGDAHGPGKLWATFENVSDLPNLVPIVGILWGRATVSDWPPPVVPRRPETLFNFAPVAVPLLAALATFLLSKRTP